MRSRVVRVVVLGVLALTYSHQIAAQASSRDGTGVADSLGSIATNGSAVVLLRPTHAMVYFQVSSTGGSTGQAAQANDHKLRDVGALLRGGPGVDSVWIENVTVSRSRDEGENSNDFKASAGVRVRVSKLDQLAEILDRGVRAGATSLGNIQLLSDSMVPGHRLALARAFEAARSDADALATAAGLRLGGMMVLSTGGGAESATYLDGIPVANINVLIPRDQVGVSSAGLISIAPTIKPIEVAAAVSVRWKLVSRR